MRKTLLSLLILFVSSVSYAQQCAIIPMPNKAEARPEKFRITKSTAIVVEHPTLLPQAHFLQQELLKSTGLTLSIQPKKAGPSIVFKISKDKSTSAGDYKLQMNANETNIISNTEEGAFRGLTSVMQLVRSSTAKTKSEISIDCWTLDDAPKYEWRGILLDESRHFFGMKTVKSILDWMAYYKLNRFHWHLTDVPGWRMEIKQYPLLTLVGGVGELSNPLKPAQYYTQEEIKEIVRYAAERFITVIPEVDMPGHAAAANRAYPAYSGGGSKRFPEFTFNPGIEGAYQYLSNILQETNSLFHANIIHLGGDEVHYGNENWSSDKHVKRLMDEKGLKDLKAVEQYFIERMADTVFKMNNKVMLWDEATVSNLPADQTIIHWWRHERPEQLKLAFEKGYSVVLSPRLPFYFDFVQDATHRIGRRWKDGEFNALDNVYNFSTSSLPAPNDPKQILGVQAALWTEVIGTQDKLEYLLYPRICALAENAWTEDKNRNFEKFTKRIRTHLAEFNNARIYFYNPDKPAQNPEPLRIIDNGNYIQMVD